MPIAARRRFWSRTKNLTLSLLLAWLLVNLLVPWFARDLSALRFFGFPLGYWLAAEGALLVYLLLIVIYVIAMDRLELAYLQQVEAGEDRAAMDLP
jgi:putative solute:sodium symporter small subunit